MSTERQGQITITVAAIKADLQNGITRKPNDPGYDANRGSIQEKYQLTVSEVNELFKHPQLVGLKVKKPSRLVIIPEEETAPSYGAPSLAARTRMEENMEETAVIPEPTPEVVTEPEATTNTEVVTNESIF